MRSKRHNTPARHRLMDRRERHLYACKCPRKRVARVWDGRLLRGTGDCSRHRCGRAMRLYWRIKDRVSLGFMPRSER